MSFPCAVVTLDFMVLSDPGSWSRGVRLSVNYFFTIANGISLRQVPWPHHMACLTSERCKLLVCRWSFEADLSDDVWSQR